MQQKVSVIKVSSEPAPDTGKNSMTIYFDKTPTCRQMMVAVSAFKNGCRNKPNLKSKKLRFLLSNAAETIRCQVVD